MRKMIKSYVDDYSSDGFGNTKFSGYVILGWMTFALLVLSPIWLPFSVLGWIIKRISEKI